MPKKTVSKFLLLVLIFIFFSFNGAQAETLNFSESAYTLDPGSSLNVVLSLGGAVDVSTAHFIAVFNPAVISYSGVTASAYFETGDEGCFIMPMVVEDPAGTVDITLSRFGCGAGVNGSGDLAALSFTASSSVGVTGLEFSDFDVCHTDFSCGGYAWGSNAVITVATSDSIAPVRGSGAPGGEQPSGTANKTLSLITDEDASCKYSTAAFTAYADMSVVFNTTGSTTHEVEVTGLSSGSSYNYYVRCKDAFGNANDNDYTISFSVAAAVSSGGGGGGGGGLPPPLMPDDGEEVYKEAASNYQGERTEDKIVLSWQNPDDVNYDKTIIIRSIEPISSYITYEAFSALGDIVYEGTDEEYIDTGIEKNLAYYYAIFTKNKKGSFSELIIIQKGVLAQPDDNQPAGEMPMSGANGYNSLHGLPGSEVELISLSEAREIYENNKYIGLNEATKRLYNFITVKSPHDLSEQDKYAIAYFIHEGSETTVILGAGERTGVLNSYLSVFSKLPQSVVEWQDVIKIGNGRWPTERNMEAENKAEIIYFKTVYKRAPDMDHPHDNAAVTVITYGLRPGNRKLDSERTAIKTFRHIFGHNPESAIDWDITRAIAYSGAIR